MGVRLRTRYLMADFPWQIRGIMMVIDQSGIESSNKIRSKVKSNAKVKSWKDSDKWLFLSSN